MIAELILMLAGHPSSLFISTGELNPAFIGLLHPGERSTLEYLARIAIKYRNLRSMVDQLGGGGVTLASRRSPEEGSITSQNAGHPSQRVQTSEYLSSMCSAIRVVLREYDELVVKTEARVLQRDDEMVASASFVPLAMLKAVFSEWDAPMAALHALMTHIHSLASRTDAGAEGAGISPGRLVDLLLERSATGVARVASIMSELALAVQRVWTMHLIAYLVHGTLSPQDPFAFVDPVHRLNLDMMPNCIGAEARESIVYVGRAIMTVKAAGARSQFNSANAGRQQLPRSMAISNSKMLSRVLPQDGREFDEAMARIRANISEWLWTTVLTRKEVDEAIESL
jgi:hypothetical protein